jgi:hypothetical protein
MYSQYNNNNKIKTNKSGVHRARDKTKSKENSKQNKKE